MHATLRVGRRLLHDDIGATAIEYALLAALIAGMLIGTVASLGGTVMAGLFQTANSQLASHIQAGS
ncbi:MAG TPA: Flp family type IVb pilin [Amaricoccus sp.]|nr:Flp family type IVb pilin [Amaricoccus sp.]